MRCIEKLLSIGSEALGARLQSVPALLGSYALGLELFAVLEKKNGFYAFEQSLHVFPSGSDITGTMTLEEWNSATLWRSAYDDLTDNLCFFGEDVFGDQFCLSRVHSGVFRFDSERGETDRISDSVEKWAELVLADYRVETGWPLGHEWQEKNGPLPLGERLHPKVPFVYGGGYSLDNLWAGDAVKGMLFKGEVALKVRNLPPGTQVRLEVKGKS
jgi:hypothetical protein